MHFIISPLEANAFVPCAHEVSQSKSL